MTENVLLAIDQGTSSSRAIAFRTDGRQVAVDQQPLRPLYPAPGWVEQDAEEIWATALTAARRTLEQVDRLGATALALGITNQRETTILWDRRTGAPLHHAIVWQDRRTAEQCRELEAAHGALDLQRRTGLRFDPYFSASKIAWILDRVPGARAAAAAGRVAFGTVDSFLLWRLTGGRVHATDATNASRTALYDIVAGRWDSELCELFGVPLACLPDVRDSAADFGTTDPAALGRALPIRGIAGDQQAALVGQACFGEGDVKSTYGTGAFLVLNTGGRLIHSTNRLLGTIAYRLSGTVTYALEGSILSAGAAIQWLCDGLGLVGSAAEVESLAREAADAGGVYLVPAFTGLGAPYWDAQARGALLGLTRATSRAHIARAALDAVAYQTHDLLEAMAADGRTPQALNVDGGMAQNDLFLQRLADLLGLPIARPRTTESTAFGAACLSGLGVGAYRSLAELAGMARIGARFAPSLEAGARAAQLAGWRQALARVRTS